MPEKKISEHGDNIFAEIQKYASITGSKKGKPIEF
jgi:hypothetical protein